MNDTSITEWMMVISGTISLYWWLLSTRLAIHLYRNMGAMPFKGFMAVAIALGGPITVTRYLQFLNSPTIPQE